MTIDPAGARRVLAPTRTPRQRIGHDAGNPRRACRHCLSPHPMRSSFLRRALVLGLLSAIGPFAVDMYLPALPAIGLALRADVHAVQLSLMAFFVSFAISQ